jgi:1-acyl-sn-glycerol-3-phosphate acyltransferase
MERKADTRDTGAELLALIEAVAAELHPNSTLPPLGLDSDLAREAGLDSLGRIELMLRIQHRFGARLADEEAITAATPRELLKAIAAAPASGATSTGAAHRVTTAKIAAGTEPASAETLIDVLDQRAAATPDAVHVRLLGNEAEVDRLTYGDLHAGALGVAAGLRAHGIEPGDTVALMLPTGLDFFLAFHGVLRAGGVPIPLYPPVRPEELESHARRLAAILDNAQARLFVATPQTRPAGRILQGLVPALRTVETVDRLRQSREPPETMRRAGTDLAFLQYTSGTTGAPKGVMLSHANLLANIRAMGTAVGADASDRFVSWLPLYHDMGLIGACLATLYYGIEVILMSPLQFMARPERWLWAIHNFGGTISAGPNFAYDLCAGRVRDEVLEGLDLSAWRLAFNGAEPVSADTLERFTARFGPFGFRAEAMMPVYGLAESSVGLAFPPPGRGARIDTVERVALERDGRAIPAAADATGVLRFVACGSALRGHELRIVDTEGSPLPERHEGRLQFRGPSCTTGYHANPHATARLFTAEGWLEAGDRGYIADGEIHLTGRIKDMIIRAGRNLYPQDIEAAVAAVDGIRKNNVAAFGTTAVRAGAGTAPGSPERLVVMAETRVTDAAARARLTEACQRAAADVVDGGADEIHLVGPRTIPKTSSGKIRRGDCRELYERGTAGHAHGTARQIARLLAATAGTFIGRAPRATLRTAYGVWCWIAAVFFGLPAAMITVATPGTRARSAIARALARTLMALVGVRLRIHGEVVHATPNVIVANHASFTDGLILRAALPGPLVFVAKRELANHAPLRWFLERIGAEFVERVDFRRGLDDLARIEARAARGETVVAFAEGMIADGAGLRDFRMGPFVVAARAGLPVMPVALRGTRRLLRASAWLPAPAAIEIVTGEPIPPSGREWNDALALRLQTRTFIAAHCGEPDLTAPGAALIRNL